MTDIDTSEPVAIDPNTPEARALREKAAKQRFFIFALFRFSGIAILAVAYMIILERFDFISGQKARTLGGIIAFIGLAQTIIVPRMLARIWRTPRL